MSLLPDYMTKKNYREAKTWFLESNICLTRAWIIFINMILRNQNDFHGSVEALQHANELSIKSLYLLVGLDWEFSHNPAKNIDEVMDRYFEIFPSLKTNDIMNAYVEWMKEHGKELAKIHNWVIYGKLENKKRIFPSKLFNDSDFNIWINRTSNLLIVLEGFFLNIGKKLGVLSEAEEKEIMRLVKANHKIRTDEKYRNKLKTKVLEGLKK